MMKELIDLIQTYDPGYSKKIRGAAEAEITRLTELVGIELPLPYQEFLRAMGKSMGDFRISDTDFTIDTVMEVYDEENSWRPPDRYLFIAQSTQDPYLDLYLDLEELVDDEYKVVCFSNDGDFVETMWSLIDTFRGLLFASAFRVKRLETLGLEMLLIPSKAKTSARATSPAQTMVAVEELALKAGFRKLPFSLPLHPMYDREGAAILGNKAPIYGGISFEIAATSDRELKKLAALLESNTSLLEG